MRKKHIKKGTKTLCRPRTPYVDPLDAVPTDDFFNLEKRDQCGLCRSRALPKVGDAYFYTNSNALGLVTFAGINPHTGAIIVVNEAAPDKHLRQVASWDVLRRCPENDITPPKSFNGYLLRMPNEAAG